MKKIIISFLILLIFSSNGFAKGAKVEQNIEQFAKDYINALDNKNEVFLKALFPANFGDLQKISSPSEQYMVLTPEHINKSESEEDNKDDDRDDGGGDAGPIAQKLRAMALAAMRTPPGALTMVGASTDLPLAAALVALPFARHAFRDGFSPYDAAGAPGIGFARAGVAPVDMVRVDRATALGSMVVIDAASFMLISPPDQAPDVAAYLRLDTPPLFQGPDADGWLSTAPHLPVERCRRWSDRIDALDANGRRLLLLFKVDGGATVFMPSAVWF